MLLKQVNTFQLIFYIKRNMLINILDSLYSDILFKAIPYQVMCNLFAMI